MMRTIVGLSVMIACSLASAAEVLYSGGDASDPADLARAANWTGGALPGVGDVGVIDLSQTAGLEYAVRSDFALAGLKVVNNGSKAVKFSGSATLTLGAGGFTSGSKGSFDFTGPLATAADQTWAFAESTVTTRSTISGTGALTIDNFYELSHAVSPRYDGTMTYTNCKRSSGAAGIRIKANGKWAKDVYVDDSKYPEIKTAAPIAWKTIFPEGTLHMGWGTGPLLCSDANSLVNPISFNDGDSVDLTGPHQLQILGPVEQYGGTVSFHSQYFMTLGSSESTSNWREHVENIRYLISGGTLTGGTLEIGNYYCGRTFEEVCRFEQAGGLVRLATAENGGGVVLAPGGKGTASSIVEYAISGGRLSTSRGNEGAPSVCLCGPCDAGVGGATPAAFFTQSGGTVDVHRITLGAGRSNWSNTCYPVNDGYGRYDLSGGELRLAGMNGDNGFSVRKSWNDNASVSNGVYALRFKGGAFIAPEGACWNASVCFPKTAEGTVLGSENRNLTMAAPIWGTGCLVKEGTGGLFLTDATRFTGSLDVRAGTVTMKGAVGVEDADDCFCWTADSLAQSLGDGDRVANWTDVGGQLTMTTNGCRMVEKRGFQAPAFRKNAYNGHSAVHFDKAGMMVAKAHNPIYGRTNCMIVAVLKPDEKISRSGDWYFYYDNVFLSVYPTGSYGTFSVSAGKQGAGVGRRIWGNTNPSGAGDTRKSVFSCECASLDDGAVHAVAFAVNGETMSVTMDGSYTNQTWAYSAHNVAPIGWVNSARTEGNNVELQFGAHALDGSDSAYFKGDILELRIYTNRLYTAAEQRAITRKLIEKYDGRASQLAKFESCPSQVPQGSQGAFTSWTAPTPAATPASWDADDIAGEDGAAVDSWTSEDGTRTATCAISGLTAPVLVKNAINGHAALRFSCTGKTGLGIAAADSPVSGARSFAAAIVWRSEREWASWQLEHRNDTPGLLSSRQAASGSADFTLSYNCHQSVMGGYGHEKGDQTLKTCKPSRLNDGEVHVSVISCDGDANTYKLMTDGVFFEGSLSRVSDRGAFDVLIGASRKGATSTSAYFDGDIAAVKLYGTALTKAQMRDLGEAWAKKYASQLLVGFTYAPEAIREVGLGATNVAVAAGARLSLPVSDTAPFTLGAGATLSGEGTFLGTYRFMSGATFDISSRMPEVFDELNLSGGAVVRVTRQTLGVHVRKLTASGANFVDIVAGAEDLRSRETLLTFDEADVSDDAIWTVRGGQSNAHIRVDMANRRLILRSPRGILIIVR